MSRRKKRSAARKNDQPSAGPASTEPAHAARPLPPSPTRVHKGLFIAAALLQVGWLTVLLMLALMG